MAYTLILLRHGHSDWNAKNLFTGWVDVDLNDQGREEAVNGGKLLKDKGVLPDRRAHLGAAPGDHHRQPGARRRRPPLDPGAPRLAAQRAALRRAAGPGQGGHPREVRRRAVHAVAPVVRHPAAADRGRVGVRPVRRPALRGHRGAAHRVPQGRHRAVHALLGGRRSRTTCGPARRCWSRRTATACAALVKHLDGISDDDIAGLNIPTGQPLVYTLGDDFMPTGPGEYLDPEAAAEAAAAVANQGR